MCVFRQRSHHPAQSSKGEGGERHASERRSAAVQPRDDTAAPAAGTQRNSSPRTHQQRGRQGHPAAPGEDKEAQLTVSTWVFEALSYYCLMCFLGPFLIICLIVETQSRVKMQTTACFHCRSFSNY